jgi:hypothetical protein
MSTRTLTTTAASVLAGAVLTLGSPSAESSAASITRGEARALASEFFRTINARNFERTCELLSTSFFTGHGVADKTQCAWRLTLAFAWSAPIRFEIVGIRVDGHRAVVHALAGGAKGRVVLVREDGALRILAVRGG